MRMKMVCNDRTLREVVSEFLPFKKAQKVRERTLNDYKKNIDKFLEQSDNSLNVDVLKVEVVAECSHPRGHMFGVDRADAAIEYFAKEQKSTENAILSRWSETNCPGTRQWRIPGWFFVK